MRVDSFVRHCVPRRLCNVFLIFEINAGIKTRTRNVDHKMLGNIRRDGRGICIGDSRRA